jgi:hypothetical protein
MNLTFNNFVSVGDARSGTRSTLKRNRCCGMPTCKCLLQIPDDSVIEIHYFAFCDMLAQSHDDITAQRMGD